MTEDEDALVEQAKRVEAGLARLEEKVDAAAAEMRGLRRTAAEGASEVKRGAGLGSVRITLKLTD